MWENFSKDTVVSERACKLVQAVITSNGVGEADATLYDGLNTSGRKILMICATDENMHSVRFNPPLPCSEGLYLDVGTNVDGVLVVWE